MGTFKTVKAFPHSIRASARLGRGDYEVAVEEGYKALELNPGAVLSYILIGLALEGLRRFDELRDLAREGLKRDPTHPGLNRMMVKEIVYGGGSAEAALPYLETYWRNRPK